MNDTIKKMRGKFYQIDEERKVVIYNTKCNNYGKFDESVDESAQNMAKIAKKENMPVETTFFHTTFCVTPGMTPEQGVEAYMEATNRAAEERAKTPAYQAEKKAEELRIARLQAKAKIDDEFIKDEKLNVEGHQRYFDKRIAKNPTNGIIQSAIRWGRLMQAEMKKQGLDHLTPKLVNDTETRAALWEYGLNGGSTGLGRNFLISTWQHGAELAQIYGFDNEKIALARTLSSDKAQELYATYKAPKNMDPKTAITESSKILALVLRDEKLIQKYYERISEHGMGDLKDDIPIINLPDDKLSTFRKVCQLASRNLRETKEKFPEKSSPTH